MLYLLFVCSGFSGLVYQVAWVRGFGNVFGNTVYSASLVVAIFMLGLGAGSYAAGAWADRRYTRAPDSLLLAYGYAELLIAALGLFVSFALPHLGLLSARSSSYVVGDHGWFVLSAGSYAARAALAIALLGPITMLMGGTLTLLIRHLVRRDVVSASSRQIARLYAANTAGAAAGALLTDFLLVPTIGLSATQMIAVAANGFAGCGALWLAASRAPIPDRPRVRTRTGSATEPVGDTGTAPERTIRAATSLGLALIGFAGMGMEIVWFRHLTVLLGGFRAVLSLLLTVILAGICLGALAGGAITRRTARPADWLVAAQAAFVVLVLIGLGAAGAGRAADASPWPALARAGIGGSLAELWLNLRPILLEVGVPSILMGCSFPLANAIVQHAERSVARSAGLLYLANTAGAVSGSLAAGFLLLPTLGMQATTTTLMAAAALAAVPLSLPASGSPSRGPRRRLSVTGSLLASAVALSTWSSLPSDHVIRRAMTWRMPGQQLLTMSEGLTDVIAVTEAPGRGRGLITDGHPMASTAWLDQRYMRALAHIPLLSLERPQAVLVIGFGVGNSAHAATLHPSVTRVDVVDLSRHVLEHADYFRDANRGVLHDRRIAVYVNDGRQHLQMQPPSVYDVITLEPPPITHAGVASLYSREFYALARTRLTAGGFLGQWLPAYQVPPETTLAMVRAFVDVFPQSVLLSGMQAELLLVGTTAARIEIDPDRLARALERAPDALADLRRLDLGTATEIIGTFLGSADTLANATRESRAVTDDRPLQEYVVGSAFGSAPGGVPASLSDLSRIGSWCPRCFHGNSPDPAAAGLDTYLMLLNQAYHVATGEAATEAVGRRRIFGSAYLGAVVPDTDAVHNAVGVAWLGQGRLTEAIASFREALKRREDSVEANRNLGVALAGAGRAAEAIEYLRRAVALDARDAGAQHELGTLLLEQRAFAEAADHFRAALGSMPASAVAHNDLGTALASMGRLREAVEQFEQASRLDPGLDEARRNLASARRARQHGGT